MNKYVIITLFLLLLPLITAQEQYLTWGVSRDNTFQQDGTGQWTGRAAATFQQSGSFRVAPLVDDIDNDGINEIIIMDGATLKIFNYTTGVGLILEASVNVGTQSYGSGNDYWITPGLLDYDSDNFTEVIVVNQTHAIVYEWNTTALTLEQNVSHGGLTRVGSMNIARYSVIKCAPGIQWADDKARCVLPYMHWSGSVQLGVLQYNLDLNLANISSVPVNSVSDARRGNTHVADVDNNGFLEVITTKYDAGNDDVFIFKTTISSSGNPSISLIKTHSLSGNALFTDVIISNLDGTVVNGLEITWGYTSDGTNWDAFTIDHTGATVDDSYCLITSCPEGELASLNLIVATDTTYCDFSGDVYYYVRNAANNDPGTNTDTVHCITRFAGAGTKETTISNTVNFTSFFFIHQVSLYGSTGLLTSLYGVQGSTKQSFPALIGQPLIIPVDYQQSGSLDLIGVVDQSTLTYYDDAFTNQNVVITSISFDTANPICRGEILGLTLTLTDDLNNVGFCHVQELNVNLSQKSIQSNSSFVTPGSVTLNYLADETGTFPLKLRCRDQFHTDYSSQVYTVTITNNTNACNFKGSGGSTVNFQTTNETASNQNFADNVNTALADLGVRGTVFKGIIWVIAIMLVVGGIAFEGSRQGMNSQAVGIMTVIMLTGMLVLGWFFNMLGTVPLVLFGLVLVGVIGFKVFSNSANVTGGG